MTMPRRVCLAAVFAAWGALAAVQAAEPARVGPKPIPPTETSCFICHAQLDGAALEPTKLAAEDVHFSNGLACHDCHGGNPAAGADGDPFAAHDESMGFAGKPARLDVPRFCAKCHSDATFMKRYDPQARVDQLSEYLTSVHGRKNSAGDDRTAVCVDCHGAHGIRPVRDPRSTVYPTNLADTCARCHSDQALMSPYGLTVGQVEDYRTSVHARALYGSGDVSAPTCNDCHGSHGAVPPGVDQVSFVCGSCHTREATLFREVEAKKGLDLEPCIQCVICHSNHAVQPPTGEMIGVGPASTCTPCHGEGEPGWVAAEEMGKSLETLRATIEQADGILEEAEKAGVEIRPDRLALQAARDNLIESRVLVHSFDVEKFRAAAGVGITAAEAGVAAGHRAFEELRRRRTGLALSLIVIAGVIGALVMTIRRIER